MWSINTGALRSERTVDMCVVIQRGCNSVCKHPNALKCTAVQANRSVQSARADTKPIAMFKLGCFHDLLYIMGLEIIP